MYFLEYISEGNKFHERSYSIGILEEERLVLWSDTITYSKGSYFAQRYENIETCNKYLECDCDL